MNADERRVFNYLNYLGYEKVDFEPDGGVPPDFLVNGNIAIEARRLNQNYFNGTEVKGLVKDSIKMDGHIDKLLNSFGAPIANESWFIRHKFARPIGQWKILEPKIKQALQTFLASPNKHEGQILLKTNNFELSILRKANNPQKTVFTKGIIIDNDFGGRVIEEMAKNINYCINEKSKKIERFRFKYKQWWLVLVDYIGNGLNQYDIEMLRSQVPIKVDWDKIIIINSTDYTQGFEI